MGSHAIPLATVNQIKDLLAKRVPQREIARITGVGRMTVSRIATGTHRPALGLREDKPERDAFLLEPIRCPGCGRKISVLPCLACKMRQ